MIKVTGLHKKFRGRPVLKGVSFTVEKDKVTCLLGANGTGKSTVLKAIAGLIPIDKGSILVDGKAVRREIYEHIAFVPDHLIVPPSFSLSRAMVFMQDFYRSWNPGRAEELMRFFQLDAGEKVGNLSKGTAAKFHLLLGLSLDTGYVLLDEPFSGIDLFSREAIADVFSSEWIEGRGVLLTTHEIEEIEHLIDKAVLLKDGAVEREFDCEQIRLEEGKSVLDVMREVYRQ